jgi:hypothetical protein
MIIFGKDKDAYDNAAGVAEDLEVSKSRVSPYAVIVINSLVGGTTAYAAMA